MTDFRKATDTPQPVKPGKFDDCTFTPIVNRVYRGQKGSGRATICMAIQEGMTVAALKEMMCSQGYPSDFVDDCIFKFIFGTQTAHFGLVAPEGTPDLQTRIKMRAERYIDPAVAEAKAAKKREKEEAKAKAAAERLEKAQHLALEREEKRKKQAAEAEVKKAEREAERLKKAEERKERLAAEKAAAEAKKQERDAAKAAQAESGGGTPATNPLTKKGKTKPKGAVLQAE